MNDREHRPRQRLGSMVLIAGVALASTGCTSTGGTPFGVLATEEWVRNYVKEQNAPIQTRVAQVEGRIDKVDARVGQVDGRVTQVAGQTAEARKVADEGVRKADAADARVTRVSANRYKRMAVETASLKFDSGKFTLNSGQKAVLDGVVKKLADNPTYTLDIVGYTDAEGAKKDNYILSWRREEHVRRYLAENSAEMLHRIAFIGMGEDMADGPKRDAADRQVLITIYRPAE